jgi:hypothetical protein
MANPVHDEETARAARAALRRERMLAEVAALPETPEARIELMFELTRAAWAMTGLPLVRTPRAEWPGRIRALGEPA